MKFVKLQVPRLGLQSVGTDAADGGFVASIAGDPRLLGEGPTRTDALADWACKAWPCKAPRYWLANPARWVARHLSVIRA